MPIVWTERNHVIAYEADEEDTHVQVTWLGPSGLNGGEYAKQFRGPVEPIEQYQSNLDWAVAMADSMQYPLHVVPLRSGEAADAHANAYLAEVNLHCSRNITDQHRGELRRIAVAVAAQALRDSDDPDVRAAAYSALLKMKVVRP